MKEFLLPFTIIQLIIVITGVPDRCGNGVKYSYPGDPTKFVVCENHIPLAKKCPIGTSFNENVQVCDTVNNSQSSQTSSRIIEVIGGTSNYGSSSTVNTEQKWTGQNREPLTYVNPNNYNSQSTNQNDFEGNRVDQSLGTGHNNQHNLNSNLGQSFYHTPSVRPSSNSVVFPSSGQPIKQSFGNDGQSGYNSGSSVSNNNVRHPTNLGQGLQSNSNQHYAGTSQSSYRENIASSHSSGSNVPTSGCNNGRCQTNVPTSGCNNGGCQTNANQGQQSQYNNQHLQNTGIKTHQQYSGTDISRTSNDHKNNIWLQNQNNHGLDQNHINLNEIGGSNGHSTNSCNKVAPGEHIPCPGDCTKFIVCMEDGNNVVKNCPPKTHFNARLQICDWPVSAGCAN